MLDFKKKEEHISISNTYFSVEKVVGYNVNYSFIRYEVWILIYIIEYHWKSIKTSFITLAIRKNDSTIYKLDIRRLQNDSFSMNILCNTKSIIFDWFICEAAMTILTFQEMSNWIVKTCCCTIYEERIPYEIIIFFFLE